MLPGLHCPVIGLLGGIAAGKSLVAQQLARLGAGVLDADQAGHDVLLQPEVVQAVVRRWGPEVLNPDGTVNRSRLAQLVFGNKEELKHLEAITRGWSPEQFRRREAAQEPLEEKRRRADVVIDNSGSPEQTRKQVEQLWREWMSGWSPKPACTPSAVPPG